MLVVKDYFFMMFCFIVILCNVIGGILVFPIFNYPKAWPHSFTIYIVDIGVSSS